MALPKRRLRVQASSLYDKTGIATQVSEHILEDVDQFLSRNVRDKFFDWAERNIEREVAENIRQGKQKSGYPIGHDMRRHPEGRLLRSLTIQRSGSLDSISVSLGKGLPYNRSYNAKKSEVVLVRAQSGSWLKFPQRHRGQRRRGQSAMVRRRAVRIPGRDILGEALSDTERKSPAKLQSIIREQQRSLGRSRKYKMTADGVKIYVGGTKRVRRR